MACQCLRVDQLDANVLDHEIRVLTQDSVDEVVRELPIGVSRFCDNIGPEIKLTLDALLWSHRYFRAASAGQELMDIAYREYTPKRVATHFFVSAFLPYITGRITDLRPEFSKIHAKLEAIYENFGTFRFRFRPSLQQMKDILNFKLIDLCHFLLFLRSGGTSTIAETLLSLRNWNNQKPQISPVNYDTQNRELLWHTFRDALLLVWPIAKLTREKFAQRQNSRNAPIFHPATPILPSCVICSKPPVIPMIGVTCGHVMCYYCSSAVERVCPLWCKVQNDKKKMIFMNQFLMKNDEKNEIF